MEEKEYIQKWLEDALSPEEQKAFEQFESYAEITKINGATRKFKVKEFDVNHHYDALKTVLDTTSKRSHNTVNKWKFWALRVAAIFIVAFCGYFFLESYTDTITTMETTIAAKQEAHLPDNSKIVLNAVSSLQYNAGSWEDNRSVQLKGEAYFKVAKGKKFTVHTSNGIVAVLGTQFNVKNRGGFFEITCYEGLVEVTYAGDKYQVPGGSQIKVLNKKVIQKNILVQAPQWTQAKSTFESTPFSEVLSELERQYDIAIINKSTIDASVLFSGSFTHKDLTTALKSITIPLQLKFHIKNKQVTIFN